MNTTPPVLTDQARTHIDGLRPAEMVDHLIELGTDVSLTALRQMDESQLRTLMCERLTEHSLSLRFPAD